MAADRGVLDCRSDAGDSWRMGDAGEFRETGFPDTLDPRTRKRMPNPSIELAVDTPAATIRVRYADTTGRRIAGAFSDQIRSGSRIDPRSAKDPRHDRDKPAVVSSSTDGLSMTRT
jgi:hypothetical protein